LILIKCLECFAGSWEERLRVERERETETDRRRREEK
jgi:hypothetical protein